MKNKRFHLVLVVGLMLAGLTACLFWSSRPKLPPPHLVDYRSEEAQTTMARVQARNAEMRSNATSGRMPNMVSGFTATPNGLYVEAQETNDSNYLGGSNLTNWPEDSRPEVRVFYKFAKTAKLYNFDPNVIYDKDEDFPHFTKSIATATHFSELDTKTDRIQMMYSKRDRSASLGDYPGVTDGWANATGNWHERQMVDETLRILRELGYTETLTAVSQGRHEFNPEAWRVKSSEGGFKTVYPFATVKLYGPNVSGDPNEPPRVTAQYRMGPNGPVGLVDWFSLY